MYSTRGIDTIANITELRSKTSDLLAYVRNERARVLVQKNNEAYAVLLDWETYRGLVGGQVTLPEQPGRRASPDEPTESGAS